MSTGKEVSITQICLQDVDSLVENFCFPWDTPEKTREKWERYFDEQQNKLRVIGVLKCSGEIVGYGSLLFKSEYPLFVDVPEISDVWIHERHRGVGYGTTLIKWFEVLAKKRGYTEVGIGVGLYADYGTAQKLYIKLGYVPNGRGITYKCKQALPGTSYPLDDDLILWMTKPLEKGSS